MLHRSFAFPGGLAIKNPPAMQEMQETWIWPQGWEDPLEGKNGNPLQCSCLENPMDREAWQATVCGVAKSWAQLTLHRAFRCNQI